MPKNRKTIRNSVMLTLVIGMVLVCAFQLGGNRTVYGGEVDAWPMFRHDVSHSGYSTSYAPVTNQTLWVTNVGSTLSGSSPAVVDGVAYVGDDNGFFHAFNTTTGVQIWSYTAGGAIYSSPAVVNGAVYVASYDKNVYALNTVTGVKIWNYTTGGTIYSSPTVVDGVVYIGSDDYNMYALDAATGAKIWNYTTGWYVYSPPCVVDGVVYFGSYDNKVYALNAASGVQIWNYSSGSNAFTGATCVAGDLVYAGSQNGRMYALNAASGSLNWSYDTGARIYTSSPAFSYGTVYFGSENDNLYALNATTGAKIWNYTTGGNIDSSPAVAGGIVYVGSYDHKIYAFNATDGSVIWSYTTGSLVTTSPAVCNGVVYIGSYDSKLYAFGLPPQYSLTMTTVGHGSVLPGNQTYSNGTLVDLIAIPDAGWGLSGWSGDATGSSNTSIIMFGNKTVTATFTPLRTLTMLTSVHGSVTPGNQSYPLGAVVSIEAMSDAGWSFSGWSGDATGTDNPTSITMDGNKTVTATFTPNFGLTTITNGQGTISPSNQTFPPGTVVDITATGATGWGFSEWSGDLTGTTNPTSITMDSNKTVTATFTAIPYNVTFTESGLASGTSWSVTFNGVTQSSTTSTITFSNYISSSYSYSITTPDGYICGSVLNGTITISGADVNLKVQFVSTSGDSWPMRQHDIFHTGYSASTGPATNNTLWSTTLTGAINSSAAIVDGVVYVGSQDCNVYALNATTGAQIWTYATGNSVYSSPAVVGGVVYVTSTDGYLYALNTTMGTQIWNRTVGSGARSSPTVVGGVVYVGLNNKALCALNATTGSIIWARSNVPVSLVSSPAVANGIVYVGLTTHYLVAFNASTGLNPWTYSVSSGGVYSSPTVVGGIVYFGADDGRVYAVNVTSHAAIWGYLTGGYVRSSPAFAYGIIYIGSNDGNVYALNATTGTQIWNYTTLSSVQSSPAVADGIVYVGSNDGKVYALDAITGSLLWTYTTGDIVDASPAIVNGVVYIGSNDGTMYAFATPQYTLTMITVGQGTVTPGNQTYTAGTVVDLQATVTTGWAFTGWSGDASGSDNPTSITMDGNKTVNATFTQNQYTLTVNVVGSGCSVTKNPSQATYTYGTNVQLTANAAAGWAFSGWNGDLTGTTNPASITIDSNKTVTATFAQNQQYTLTVNVVGAGCTVTQNPSQSTYTHGITVQLTANPAVGWSFIGWSQDLTGTINPASIIMDGNKVVTATFTQDTYTLTINTIGNGSATPDNPGPYRYGDVVQLTATASAGWSFNAWSGAATGSANPTALTITGNMQVTAGFAQNRYTLTVNIIGAGCGVTKNLDQTTYTYGTNIQLTAIAAQGWSFSGWSGDLTGTANPATITIDGDKTVTAAFTQNQQYTLTVNVVGAGCTVTKSPDQATYTYGTNVQLTPIAASGYTFSGWSGDLTGAANPASITMDGDKTVTATFTQNQQYTLTINVVGSGCSVTKNPSQATYAYGASVQLTANAASGWVFIDWSGDLTGTTNPATVTMDSDKTVTATFSQNACTIMFAASGIGLDFTGTALTVDGADYAANALPLSFTWISGSEHTFAYAAPLSAGSGIQYTWSSTEGLSNLQNGSLTAAGSGTVTGNYSTQYYLTVISAYGTAGGSGWYDAGTSAQATLSALLVQADEGTRFAFSGWLGDASGSTSPSNSILMDGPKTATANWATQYFLVVASAYGSPTPLSGWYDSGSQIAALISPPETENTDTHYVCTGWSGIGSVPASGTAASITFAIDMSSAITWNWNVQYQVTFTQSNVEADFTGTVLTVDDVNYDGANMPSFWWDADSVHTFSFQPLLIVDSASKQYVWTSASGFLTLQNGSISATSPGNIAALYSAQYHLAVTSAYGTAYGTGWYTAGTTVYATLSASATSPSTGTRNVFTAWSGDASGTNYAQSSGIVMDSAKTATATWKTQYYLTVNSAHGSSTGEGWYDSGSTAPAALAAGTILGDSGTQYVFAGWAGDASGSELTTNPITMNAPKTATANWLTQYQLAVASSGNSGGNMSLPEGVNVQSSGSQVTITANPQTGYTFAYWLLDGQIVTDNPLNITMTAHHTVRPVFDRLNYTLTILPSDNGGTNVTAGAYSYNFGTNVTLTAAPAAGYLFDHWAVDGANVNSRTVVIMANEQHTVQAFFQAEAMNLTVPVALAILLLCIVLIGLVVVMRRRKKSP